MDDLWLGRDGRVMVADYKATAKAEHVTAASLHPAYRRQADVYQFLVAQQGLEVSDRAWFVYANGLKTADGFHDTLHFDTRLVPYDGDRSWVLEAFRAAVSLVVAGQRPDPGPECAWCSYADGVGHSIDPTAPAPSAPHRRCRCSARILASACCATAFSGSASSAARKCFSASA